MRKYSLLEKLCGDNSKMLYYLLHTISNYLQNMVDNRVTTELVSGYQSHLQDVRDMYNNKDKKIIEICLSKEDLACTFQKYQ